jgi:ribose 5-phosphate isomerase B
MPFQRTFERLCGLVTSSAVRRFFLGGIPVTEGVITVTGDLFRHMARVLRMKEGAGVVLIDGAGIGSCMSANKVPGVRAAMCYDHATAVNSREHNDANVLTLGAGLLGVNLAKAILKTWLATEFGGGRHATRVNKIISIEKSFLKEGKS